MAGTPQDNRLRAGDIISRAIQENRWGERLLYGFATAFVLAGLFSAVWGTVQGNLVALAGVLAAVFFVPAVVLARRIRDQNLALRLLEIPLRRAKTADEAARVLIRFVEKRHGIGRTPDADNEG